MGSGILMHVRANPLLGTGRLLRSLTLARQWIHDGGKVVFVPGRLPGVLMRQIAIAGCEARRLPLQPGDTRFARDLCRLAHDERCAWIVMDDSSEELIQKVSRYCGPDQRSLVLGSASSEADFSTDNQPAFALIRRNLNSGVPVRLANRRKPKRCLLDLSTMGGEDSANLIRTICKQFTGTGIVFDVVTPFAATAAEQLYRQEASIREYMFWHRNADRAFQALFAFHLVISVDEANFYETAYSRIASVLLSEGVFTESLPIDLTTLPWFIDRRRTNWVEQVVDAIEKFFDSPTGLARHAAEMVRLVDGQAALRLCRVLNEQRGSENRVRSA